MNNTELMTTHKLLQEAVEAIELGLNWLTCTNTEHMTDGQYDTYQENKNAAHDYLQKLKRHLPIAQAEAGVVEAAKKVAKYDPGDALYEDYKNLDEAVQTLLKKE